MNMLISYISKSRINFHSNRNVGFNTGFCILDCILNVIGAGKSVHPDPLDGIALLEQLLLSSHLYLDCDR